MPVGYCALHGLGSILIMQNEIKRSVICCLLAITCLMQGCAVGLVRYSGTEAPPKTSLDSLKDVPIYLAECPTEFISFARENWEQRYTLIRPDFLLTESSEYLTSEYGLTLKRGLPAIGERAIYVQITPVRPEGLMTVGDSLMAASWTLHFVFFATLPGYVSSTQNFNVQVAFTKPDGSAAFQGTVSHLKRQEFLWLPFILKFEYVGSINGGMDNSGGKMLRAKQGIAREIARKILAQYEAAGGVGGWRQENVANDAYCVE